MKKQLIVLAAGLLALTASASAQNGQFQRKTVEERIKIEHDKFDSTFHFDTGKQAKVDSVFAKYYRAADKAREEMMASGNPDREAMRAQMQDLAATRDGELKGILSEAEMKKWKDELEPSMRPQRGNRPPGQ